MARLFTVETVYPAAPWVRASTESAPSGCTTGVGLRRFDAGRSVEQAAGRFPPPIACGPGINNLHSLDGGDYYLKAELTGARDPYP